MSGISDKLMSLMTERKMSQRKLAQLTGISQPGISGILKGEKSPKGETLQKICSALGVSMAEFDDKPANDLAHMHEVGDRMNFQGERKAAWEKIKALSADEQRTQLDEALAEVMALSPEAREHLLGLLREIKRGE